MSSLKPIALRLAAPLAFAAAGAAVASDAAHHAEILQRLPAKERQAYIERLMSARRQTVSVAVDSTPPVLTAFNASTMLNASKANWPFKITVKATDDLSGVQGIYFAATGPSGQSIFAYAYPGFPALSVTVNGGFGNTALTRMLEPGAWKFTSGYAYDVAGNYTYVDEATLDALGNTTFTVANNSGYDSIPPTSLAGQILTPQISLAATVPGAPDEPPYAGARITMGDVGGSVLAGVGRANLDFCLLADEMQCLNLYGTVYAAGLASATFTVGAQIRASDGVVPGTYELKEVALYDQADNVTTLRSSKFGGGVDLGIYFPTTSIKVKP